MHAYAAEDMRGRLQDLRGLATSHRRKTGGKACLQAASLLN